jgi:hypothetical protein
MITLTENDNHFVTFCKDTNRENDKKLKNLRRFQTKNTDSFLKLKFWIIKDEEFAKKLGIDTTAELGDLYVIKECNEINQLESTVKVGGKDIYCKKVTNILDTSKATELYIDIVSIALAFPIIVHDFMAFAQLFTKYQSPSIIVYCDKNHPDYHKILAETYKARQGFPLQLNKKNTTENPNRDLKHNLLFIVSTQPMLIPLLKLTSKKPRVLLAYPEHDNNDVIDLRDKYWKNLKKIDGLSTEEFYKRVAEKPHTTTEDENERESVKAKFSEDRFKFTKVHSFKGEITAEHITQFIEAAQKNKLKPFFESEEIPEQLNSERVVGEDFKKKVLQSKHDCVVYLEHPNPNENRGYAKKYEKFVQSHKSGDVKFYRISDINETDVFKLTNYQSPTVLYFKQGSKATPVELDIRRDLVKGAQYQKAAERLQEFINKNSATE